MSKHTKEPWHPGRDDMQSYHGGDGQPFTNIYADDERAGMHLGHQLPLVIAEVQGEHIPREEEKANAHRICDCVNACAGLDPAAVPKLVEIATEILGDLGSGYIANASLAAEVNREDLRKRLVSILKLAKEGE
jgi:hypothetical protein